MTKYVCHNTGLFQVSILTLLLTVSHMGHPGRTGAVSVSSQDKILSFSYRPWVLDTLTRRSVHGTWPILDTVAMANTMRSRGAALCRPRPNWSPSLRLMSGMRVHRLNRLFQEPLRHSHIWTTNQKAHIFTLTSLIGGLMSLARNRRDNRQSD
jgi:hypothetical protein